MKLIKSSTDIVNISDPFRKIEFVGRTCYKSNSEMTDETARKFYKTLVGRHHCAMLEHATFVFEVSEALYNELYGYKYLNYSVEEFKDGRQRFLISGNLRALNETQEEALLVCLYKLDADLVYTKHLIRPMEELLRCAREDISLVDVDSLTDIQEHAYMKHKYHTFIFICDRGVSHEIVRHRPSSYAQESTRYCNYSKDKFGREITCIEPADYENWDNQSKYYFSQSLHYSEDCYFRMLRYGRTPQEARAVLPNALKTEVIMTANCEEFNHFFNLRSIGTTGAPHPDMKRVADEAFALYKANTKSDFVE